MKENDQTPLNRRKVLQSIGSLTIGTSFAGKATASSGSRTKQLKYENLERDARDVFESGLKNGRSNEYGYNEFPGQLLERDVVVYKGQKYSLNRDYRTETRFKMAPETIDEGELGPHDERDLVSYDELGPSATEVFRTALREGAYEKADGFPSEFEFDTRFVRYDGTCYDLNCRHEDNPQFTIAPSPLEDA